MSEHYEGSGLLLRHSPAGLRDFVDVAAVHLMLLAAEKLVHYRTPLPAKAGPVAQPHQKMPDFRLENHNQCDDTYVNEGCQQGTHQLHLQCVRRDFQYEYGNDCNEDIDYGRILYPSEYHFE